MAYAKTTWSNGEAPALNDTNLNKIEAGIETAQATAEQAASLQTATQTVVDASGFSNVLTTDDTTVQTALETLDSLSWCDLRFAFTQVAINRTTSKPDFDQTNLGLLFPQNDSSEEIYMVGQFDHDRINGSDIRPHIHWQQSQSAFPTWEIDYKWFKNGDPVPSTWTTLTSSTGVFSYVSGDLAQISSFGTIDGSLIDTASSMILVKLRRTDNNVSGDVLAWEFDCHYQQHMSGTRTEFA